MGRIKVKLRSYAISGGRRSLQLDYYPKVRHPETGKMVRIETLGMYIYEKPKGSIQKKHNEDTWAQAEAIRGIRQQAVINEEFGFLDKSRLQGDFLAYFREFASKNHKNWISAYKHFKRFMHDSCTFAEITSDLCHRYRIYILTAPKERASGILHPNTAAGYFKIFKYVVGFAYRDKWLREDLFNSFDYLPTIETDKEFLTPAELMNLSKTPCEIDVLKRAALFACLTGLRLSDVLKLTWGEIITNMQSNGFNTKTWLQKTGAKVLIPMGTDTTMLCGQREEGLIFKGFEAKMTKGPMQRWIKAGGITKHITFHCFRHTYAVLQLASGTDIYTVSKILGHKHITTTEIYLDLLEETKIGTIDRIKIYVDPTLTAA